jgi:DNA polymerase-3 subunit epsilon
MINKPISELTFTVFDTETTGLSPEKGSRLVEIAAIKIEPQLTLNLNNRFETLIDPKCEIPYQAYAVHGISKAMVKGKPTAEEVLPEFVNFVGDSIAVAHNAPFDCRFVYYTLDKSGVQHNFTKIIDTVALAKLAFPGLSRYSLDNLMSQLELNIPIPSAYRHRAMFDAAHTALLAVKCFEALHLKGVHTLKDLFGRQNKLFYKWV